MSGIKAKLYSPMLHGDDVTLYERFILENKTLHLNEVSNIDERLEIVCKETGLFQESFDTKSGKFGENLCTLKDKPNRKLRLYFIEFGLSTIVLGGGGFKPPSARSRQEVKKLDDENTLIGLISTTLQRAIVFKHLGVGSDGAFWSTTNYIYDTDNYGTTLK